MEPNEQFVDNDRPTLASWSECKPCWSFRNMVIYKYYSYFLQKHAACQICYQWWRMHLTNADRIYLEFLFQIYISAYSRFRQEGVVFFSTCLLIQRHQRKEDSHPFKQHFGHPQSQKQIPASSHLSYTLFRFGSHVGATVGFLFILRPPRKDNKT